MSLDRRLAAARARVEKLEPELAAVYEKPLRAAARGVGSKFRARAVTAAVQPRWTPPDPEDLVDGQQAATAAQPEAQQIHERALRLVGEAALGISFDLQNPFAASLIAGLATRSSEILGGFGDGLQAAIQDAHAQGLSVIDAATLIQQRALDASTVTARLLARTDLNSIANGGSLLAAQLVDQASTEAGEEGVGGKTWVTAGDERVRADHADADGQTVPLDQPFDVGGEQLMYPGDPQASLEQIANCRCVLTYGGGLTSSAVEVGHESESLLLSRQGAPVEAVPRPRGHREDDVGVTSLGDEVRTNLGDDGPSLLSADLEAEHGAPVVRDVPVPVVRALVDDSASGDVLDGFQESTVGVHDKQLRLVTKSAIRGQLPVAAAADARDPDRSFTVDDPGEIRESFGPRHTTDRTTLIAQTPTGGLQSPGTMSESPDDTRAPGRLRDFHLTAAAGEPTRWQATLLVEGEPTEDGRMIAEGATTWRALPLSLGWLDETNHGSGGAAPVIGRIDQIWRASGGVVQAAGVFNDVADSFAAECVQKIRDRIVSGISVDPAGCEIEIVVVMPENDGQDDPAEEAAEESGYEIADDPYEDPIGEDVDYLMVYTSLVIGGATVCPVQAVANAKIDLVAAAEAETQPPLLASFDATECAIAPSPIENGLSRSEVIAITHKSIDALAAAVAAPLAAEPTGEHLETLTASVATMQRELDEHRSELRTAREAAEAAQVGRERELRDTVASLQAEQRATFVQAGAVLEAIDQLTATVGDRFAALTAIDEKISRSLELAERKPRQVEVKRDDKGRMVGFVEG